MKERNNKQTGEEKKESGKIRKKKEYAVYMGVGVRKEWGREERNKKD